ncbi:MAG TPA: D-alanyl-D-alanine carboxypeptidase, partial [Rhodobacterales bacterium]|nr:D-alanyl-D-alanine carboxypeptidase [Rhodobacterales bacterium]
SRWLPVRRPDLYAGEVAQVLARAQGIKLPKAQAVTARPTGTAVAVQESADLATIVRLVLKYSTNLTAEVIGLTASQKRGVAPGDLRSSAKAMSDWAHTTFGARDMQFVDHSGLGGASRITARDMVQFLVKAGYGGPLHRLMKDIAPRGADGKVLQGAPYSIQAKTGTLNFVSSLAGYVSAADKTPLVFAIFTGDPARRADIARANMERPEGGKAWTRRARWLQHQLLRRWAGLYGV